MRITKKQLKRIIKEESAKLAEQMDPATAGMMAARRDAGANEHGVFNENYLGDMIREEIMDYLNTVDAEYLTANEAKMIERAISIAANTAVMDLVEG